MRGPGGSSGPAALGARELVPAAALQEPELVLVLGEAMRDQPVDVRKLEPLGSQTGEPARDAPAAMLVDHMKVADVGPARQARKAPPGRSCRVRPG